MNKFIILVIGLFSVSSFAAQTDISRVGNVSIKEVFIPTKVSKNTVSISSKSGKEIYQSICASCHATGVVGAPVVGDKNAWAIRIARTGFSAFITNVLNGKGAMPPKGGMTSLNKNDIQKAIFYMVSQSQ